MTSSPEADNKTHAPIRLAYLVSHPIQYQAPLLRRIAREPDIDLTVFYGSDFSVRGYKDEGFGGVGIKWDVPLLDGYRYEFLPAVRDNAKVTFASPISRGLLSRLGSPTGAANFDALWVHGYASVNSMHAMVAARTFGIPVLLRSDSWLGDRKRSSAKLAVKKLFFRGLGEMIDAVLSVGSLNDEYWHSYLGNSIPRFLMPYAVDNEYFQQRSREAANDRHKLQQELNLDPSRPVILFASKLQVRKRCDDLLEAYKLLSRGPGISPDPYLVIVGDGEQRATLEKAAKETGFDSIRFCGFRNQSELPRFFDLCNVFVLPARHEPWGLIVNEVMNAGRPVIITDEVGCQRDLITPGIEGEVFPAGNVPALAESLRRVLSTPEHAHLMGQRALERIRSWSFEEDVAALRHALAEVTRKIEA